MLSGDPIVRLLITQLIEQVLTRPSAATPSGFPIRDSGFPRGMIRESGIANPEFGIPRGAARRRDPTEEDSTLVPGLRPEQVAPAG